MAENGSTAPGMAGNNTYTGTASNDSGTGGGGNDVVYAGSGDDRIAGDGPLQGQWTYSVYTRDFTADANQTGTISSGTLQGAGYVDDFNVLALRNTLAGTAQGTNQDDFGVIYRSTLNIQTTGTYTFGTTSDDGSRAIIRDAAGNVVFDLDNDRHQAATTVNKSVTLQAGQSYSIELYYWENQGGQVFSATIAGPGFATSDLATSNLVGVPPTASGHVDGSDTLYGDAGSDTLSGGGGNDLIYGGTEADSLTGEAGNDRLYGDGGNDTLSGGTGDDTLFGGTEADVLWGDDGNDLLYGDAGRDTLHGGAGDDTLYGGTEADSLMGDDGNDRLFVDAGSDTVSGGAGDDSLYGGADADSLSGDAGKDLLYGDVGNDILSGGADDDTIYGGADADSLTGDDGNDQLYGDAGNDTLSGGLGADTLSGDDGNDLVYGDAGSDILRGGVGDDTLYGGTEADSLQGDVGNDRLYGDAGNDTVSGGEGDDSLYGGADADSLSGDAGNDHLDGGSGADTLQAGDGNDTLYGGDSSDSVSAGAGADLVYGGEGNDFVLYGTGDDTVYAGAGDDFVDDLDGARLAGRNLVYAGDGSDRVYTGWDADTAYGGAGNDFISGEEGSDLILGGAGADQAYGGDDRDTFVFQDGDFAQGDSVDGGNAGDDFDTLDLSGYGWARTDITYSSSDHESGTVTFYNANGSVLGTMQFTEIEQVIPCFTAGTRVETPDGPRAVESLRPGDLVLTLDDGPQPVRWVGQRRLGLADLVADPSLEPVEIGAHALGKGVPDRRVRVSPQHRVLFGGAACELHFGEEEVLVAAIQMVGQPGISQRLRPVTYVHVMFDRHQIVQTHGLWSESFQPGERALDGLPDPQRDELLRLFPDLGLPGSYPAARMTLKSYEAQVLLQS